MYDIPDNSIGAWSVATVNGVKTLYEGRRAWFDLSDRLLKHHDDLEAAAVGDVLLGGLGLAYDVSLIVNLPGVTSVTVVEKEQAVIDLVMPYVTDVATIIHQDFYAYLVEAPSRFNLIWVDIFLIEPSYEPAAVATIDETAGACLKPGGKLLYWRKDGN